MGPARLLTYWIRGECGKLMLTSATTQNQSEMKANDDELSSL